MLRFLVFLYVVYCGHGATVLKPVGHFRNLTTLIQDNVNPKVFDYTYKLPRTILPREYNLTYALDPSSNEVTGSVKILLYVKNTTNVITLHVNGLFMTIKSAKIYSYDSPSDSANLTKFLYNKTRLAMTFGDVPSKFLVKGSICVLDINFVTRTTTGNDILGIRHFVPSGGDTKIFQAVLEALGARRVFPSFDEPFFKASFRLELNLKGSLTDQSIIALSNSLGSRSGNTWKFNKTQPLATYLLMFAVGPFKPVCMDKGAHEQCGTKLAPGQNPNVCHYLLDYMYNRESYREKASKMNEFGLGVYCKLQNYTGIQSPAELDFLWIPWGMGLENWGMIQIDGRLGENSYAHEITHYWFGDLVSPESWAHLWLSEGFANFFPTLTDILIDSGQEIDSAKSSFDYLRFIDNKASAPTLVDILWGNGFFDTPDLTLWVYTKGSVVLRMIYDAMDKEPFQTAINIYQSQDAFSSAHSEDLLKALQQSVNKYNIKGGDGKILDIQSFLHNFIYGNRFPTLNIKNLGSGRYTVDKKVPYGKPEEWHVPLYAYDRNTGKSTQKWIYSSSTDLQFAENAEIDWNKNHFAYYHIE